MQTKEPKTECGKPNRHSDSNENVDELVIHIQELSMSGRATSVHYSGLVIWNGETCVMPHLDHL